MTRTPANKGKRYPAERLTAAEIDALLSAISGRSSTAIRNRALIATMYRGALRVGETLALKPGDVDADSGELLIREGKGRKSRPLKLDAGALGLVNEWRERRKQLGFTGRQPLFCAIKGATAGGELKTAYIRALLPTLAGKAGIERRVHAHGLRHARAGELAMAGVPTHIIRDALGHTSIATTDAYLRGISPTEVYAAMESDWQPPAA